MMTPYHTKYHACELTRRCPPDSVEKLAGALVDAQVDRDPYQVDAALFAFNWPLSKGALLADEMRLAKTIDPGLVLSQKWAERKRRILVITPSNLRKQWFQDRAEKFFLPCRILEAKPYNAAIRLGLYELPRRSGEVHLYGLNHPLAEAIVAQARSRELPPADIYFDYGQHDGKVTTLESLIGKAGWLALTLFSVEALDQAEDHLIFSAVTDDGQTLDEELAQRLLTLPVTSPPLPQGEGWGEGGVQATLATLTQHRQAAIQRVISERNARFFDAEADKLDGWADDLKVGLEREIREIDRQIKEARRAATTALTLEKKLAGQKQIKALEAQRNQKPHSLFDAQDHVDKQREELIAAIEGKLNQINKSETLFLLRWVLAG